MKSTYLPVFSSSNMPDGSPLTFAGERDGDELVDGELAADGAHVGEVRNGIIRFKGCVDRPGQLKDLREKWVPHNWANEIRAGKNSPLKELCDELALLASNGLLILEVAAGPGGGNLTRVLHRWPNAAVIVNDISPTPLEAWRDFLAERQIGENVSFAAFDATKMPIRSNSLDVVSSAVGFTSITPGRDAIREARRVLKPGGCIIACDFFLARDGLRKLPPEMQRRIAEGTAVRGLVESLEAEGLSVEWHERGHSRDLSPDEGGWPAEAAKHGVTLTVTLECVKARKPIA